MREQALTSLLKLEFGLSKHAFKTTVENRDHDEQVRTDKAALCKRIIRASMQPSQSRHQQISMPQRRR